MNITYTPETEESLTVIAEKLTGYPQYSKAIAEYNNLPESMETIPAGQTIVIPQSWAKTETPMTIEVTGGTIKPDRKWLWIGALILGGLLLMNAEEDIDDDAETV